ncbi:MAG TPA: hypothetical protein VGJ05_04245 [Fimbriiglobus sp.]|jgi:hypothetical protein
MVRCVPVVCLAVILGCGDSGSSTPLPIVKATVDNLSQEYAADPGAFRKKYDNVRVEFTGTVDYVRNDDATESVIRVLFKPTESKSSDPVEVAFHLSQELKILALVPGQIATVRGVLGLTGLQFEHGELVDPGPSPETSISTLIDDAKMPEDFKKKYVGAGMKLTGKVVEVRRKLPVPSAVEYEVFVGAGSELLKVVVCKIRTSEKTEQRYKLISLRRGEKVTVVGRVAAVNPEQKEFLTLEHAHILQ